MDDQKEESVEEYQERFSQDWKREAYKLIAFTQTDPFRNVAKEIEIAIDAILHRRFNDPRAKTIKSLVLVHLVGKVLSEWVVPKDAPLGRVYRKLLDVTAHESALGQIILERAAKEGVDYTNRMVEEVTRLYKSKMQEPPNAQGEPANDV